ncbi:MAG: ATP-binding cassette domain-containing protein [Clostridia bacterium]|nr:ATP-binding cassette domain-containing protein [Clostridia bacterium]
MAILETRNLSFQYEAGKIILDDLNISIEKGSFVALLGANGCGKTTLAQHFNRLYKPVSGQVLLNGNDIAGLKEEQIYSSIGLVFQNPDDQLFSYTVREDVSYGVKNLGISGNEAEKRVEDSLKLLDIEDLRDREIHKLSFGQKKRVAIAGILAMKPEILVMDEPTAGLDPMTISSLMKTLKQIQLEEGLTIVIATHEVDIVPVNCDKVYVMSRGRIILEGSPEQVFKNKELLRESNLRLPRIGHLMEVLHDKDKLDVDAAAMTISKARKSINNLFKLKGSWSEGNAGRNRDRKPTGYRKKKL